ncbi:hypothetical protein [Actinomadura sp. SCN-SB]|uniref:hypothetical protein n=1 Tax=Actinomadura sp. SCN-SB TaxID=3373092 RepID=UPI0037503922
MQDGFERALDDSPAIVNDLRRKMGTGGHSGPRRNENGGMIAAAEPDRWAAPKRFLGAATAPAAFVLGLLTLAFFMLVLPGAVIYTVLWGERAVATIEACEQREVRYDATYLDCRGSWRFADGTRGSGHVSGVGRATIGQEVPVRVGPLGPYAGGLDRSRHALIPGGLLWTATLCVAGIGLHFLIRARARVRKVLAQVGEGRRLVVTGRRKSRDERGRTLLRFRASSRPPGALAAVEERRLATRRPFIIAHVPSGGVEVADRNANGTRTPASGGPRWHRVSHAPETTTAGFRRSMAEIG